MAKGPTTSRANPGETNVESEMETYGGDPDLRLEDGEPDDGHQRQTRDDDDRGAERKPPELKWEENPRDALFSKIAKDRTEQGQELSTDEEDAEADELDEDGDGDPEVVIVAGPGAREVNQPQPEKPAPRKVTDLTDDDIVVVKVDGAELEMRYGDMKSRAQKDVAADSRLDKANALLAEARRLVAEQNTRPAPASEQRPAGEVKPDARRAPDGQSQADRKARLADIVDKLQTETPEKAVDALENLIGELRQGGNTSQPDVQAVVRQTITSEEEERSARFEVGTSYNAVAETFGDVLSDPRLASMAFEDTVGLIVKTLRDAGTPEADFQAVADEVAARNAGISDPKKHDSFGMAIMREYAKVSRDPQFKLKPVRTVMEDGLKTVRKWRTGDANVPVNEKGRALAQANGNGDRGSGAAPSRPRVVLSSTRSERKAGVSVQPRSASMRTDFSAIPAARKKETSSVIAKMAEDRR